MKPSGRPLDGHTSLGPVLVVGLAIGCAAAPPNPSGPAGSSVGGHAARRPGRARISGPGTAWLTAMFIVTACATVATPSSSASASPPESARTTATATASSHAPIPSAPALRLTPGETAALNDGVVMGLASTPGGYALVGDEAAPDSRSRFLISGSADGETWLRLAADPIGPTFSSIAGGSPGWVAASDEPNDSNRQTVLWFSTDGTAWERLPDQAGIASANIATSEGNPLTAGPAGFAAVGQTIEASSTVSAVWTSRNGRTWTEATALLGTDVGQVLVLPTGFLSFSGGCCVGPGGLLFSSGGTAWRDVSSDTGSPYAMSAGLVVVASLGTKLIAPRAGPKGVVESYTGDLARLADGGPIAWQHDATADAAFTGASVSAIAAGAGSVLVLGFDRTSLEPISWTSPDGRTWTRTALDPATFGGGVPGLAAASGSADGSSFAAIGFRANTAGDVRSQVWRSADGTAWSAVDGDVLGTPPAVATGPCPATTPTVVDDFLLMTPPLWPACFGDRTLTVRGFVASCECGGTTQQRATPAWLIDPLGISAFSLVPAIVQAATGGGGFGVMIDPSHPVTVPEAGEHVELTGHFADPAAASCRVFPNDGAFGPVLPREQTVALCRQAFVVTAIRRLAP
jgi:hypothetical protein